MTAARAGSVAVLCASVAAAAAVPPARAADSKRPPKATVEIQEIDRKLTRPELPAGGRAAAGAGPVMSLEAFRADRGGKLKRITAHQIAKMKMLLAATVEDDPQKPDFYFRLGELYAENQRFCSHRARELDQKIFEAPAAGKTSLRAEQQALEREAGGWLLEAVKAYVAATRYPKYERMDEVLFRLAALLMGAGKADQSREFLHRLIKDFPASKYVPDAYLAFADKAFDDGEMESALQLYEKVAQFPRSSVALYAAYKKGWCHINLSQHKQALEAFVGVVRSVQQRAGSPDVKPLEALAREAKKDIVRAYSQVGGPDKAWEFFRRTGGDYAPKMLEALAELYWEQGKFADSTRSYKKIVAENSASPRLCEWQGKVLRNALSAGNIRDQTQELERLGVVYRMASGVPKDKNLECRNAFHDAARELALVWHREAQRTRNAETYRYAERAYLAFLAAFPDDKDAYEMGYYLGELLWSLERWKDAAEQYTRVAESNPKGKYLRDAAYAAVLAWKNVLAVDDDEPGARANEARAQLAAREGRGELAPRPIPENLQKMIAAFHAYRRHVPDAPELPVIVYREAYILYDHNQMAEAVRLFLEVVAQYPAHTLAPFAANLALDALNAQGKKREVIALVRKFMDVAALMKDPEFAAQMISLMSDAYDEEARTHERRGAPKECGRSFLAAAEALPTHRKHAERLWNAGQCFQNAHIVGQALKAWQALIAKHPADPLASKALYRVAAGYHQLAFYSMAAERYEAFARRFPGEPEAATALGNATVFREGLEQPVEALANMDTFVGNYGQRRPQEAAGVFFQKAEVFEKEGKREALRAHLRAYLADWATKGGLDRQIAAHFRLGELAWRASCPHPSEDGACVMVTRQASTRGAQLRAAASRKLGRGQVTQCGPATKSKTVVLERNRAEVAAADEHFRTAVRLWKAGEAANPIVGKDAEARRTAGTQAAAGAAFALAERDYEDLIRIKFPKGLDFSQPAPGEAPARRAATAKRLEDSKRRFASYLAEKARLLEKAREGYLAVFKLRQAHWTIAAAARIGQLHQDFAGQLYTAEIPRDLPESDRWGNHPRDLYCAALEEQAGKVEAQATDGFKSCLGAATQQSWFNEWSRLCERELNQVEPVQFPLSAEIKPEAGFVPLVPSAVPVVSALADEDAAVEGP